MPAALVMHLGPPPSYGVPWEPEELHLWYCEVGTTPTQDLQKAPWKYHLGSERPKGSCLLLHFWDRVTVCCWIAAQPWDLLEEVYCRKTQTGEGRSSDSVKHLMVLDCLV